MTFTVTLSTISYLIHLQIVYLTYSTLTCASTHLLSALTCNPENPLVDHLSWHAPTRSRLMTRVRGENIRNQQPNDELTRKIRMIDVALFSQAPITSHDENDDRIFKLQGQAGKAVHQSHQINQVLQRVITSSQC